MASQRRVLITGANGYIAVQTVAWYLQAGWSVRGTVRDLNSPSVKELAAHFAAERKAGRFELVVVQDIKKPGAFDEAVKDVQSIAHLATPVTFSSDIEYVLGTAVQGTVSILESALKAASEEKEEGKRLKSFVLMSSIAAILTAHDEAATVTEKDWNTQSEAIVKEQGNETPGIIIYAASKVASERMFWKWVEEKKPTFSATALNPVWVAGPPQYLPSSPEGLASTTAFIWKVFSGEDFPAGPIGYGAHVDVRDVARITEWASSHPEIAGGERYIVGGSGNVGVPQATADVLRKAYPERRDIIKEGTPGEGYLPGYAADPKGIVIDGSKAIKATGQDWISYDKIVLDGAKLFEGFL